MTLVTSLGKNTNTYCIVKATLLCNETVPIIILWLLYHPETKKGKKCRQTGQTTDTGTKSKQSLRELALTPSYTMAKLRPLWLFEH